MSSETDTRQMPADTAGSPNSTTTERAPQPLSVEESREQRRAEELKEYEMDNFVPRGTLLFLLVMLTGYALYWAYLWFIVVIERA